MVYGQRQSSSRARLVVCCKRPRNEHGIPRSEWSASTSTVPRPGPRWIPWPHKPHGCPRSEREGQASRKRDPADLRIIIPIHPYPVPILRPEFRPLQLGRLLPYSSIAVLCLPPACQAFRGSLPSLHALGAICLVFLPCAVGSRRRRLSTWFRRRLARLSHL